MEVIRNQGMSANQRFFHGVVGNNFRMNNLSASILSAQLVRHEELLNKRSTIVSAYGEALRDVEEVQLQRTAPWATFTPWLFSILLSDSMKNHRSEITQHLLNLGIETRPFFIPAHTMPPYERFDGGRTPLDVGVKLSKKGMNLPTSSLMTCDDVSYVVTSLKQALYEAGKA